jgi:hypothetical protein
MDVVGTDFVPTSITTTLPLSVAYAPEAQHGKCGAGFHLEKIVIVHRQDVDPERKRDRSLYLSRPRGAGQEQSEGEPLG